MLRRRANARNVSFRISSRWPTYIINPVDKTKLSCSRLGQHYASFSTRITYTLLCTDHETDFQTSLVLIFFLPPRFVSVFTTRSYLGNMMQQNLRLPFCVHSGEIFRQGHYKIIIPTILSPLFVEIYFMLYQVNSDCCKCLKCLINNNHFMQVAV